MVEPTQGWRTPEGVDREMDGLAKDLIVDWLNAAINGEATGEFKTAAQGLLALINQGQVRIGAEEIGPSFFKIGFFGEAGMNKVVRSISLAPNVVTLFHGLHSIDQDGIAEGTMKEIKQLFMEQAPSVLKGFQNDVQNLEAAGYEVVDANSWERFLEVGEE